MAVCNAAAGTSPANNPLKPGYNNTLNVTPISPSNGAKVTPKQVKPLWIDLTPAQRQALAPLSADWDKLGAIHKNKWLIVANKFPTMKLDAQQRVQEQMRAWAKLTPEQRRVARESYARTKTIDQEKKSAQWEQYQKLPDEEKKKLAIAAENKKKVANLPRSTSNKTTPALPKKIASASAESSATVLPPGPVDSIPQPALQPATK